MPDTPLNPDALEAVIETLDDKAAHYSLHLLAHEVEDIAKATVSAYLAVAQPEVNSVEELDALPVESVLLDADNCVMQILHNGEQYLNGDPFREYCMVGDTRGYEPDEVALPARVLYRPEVNDA